jgi:hypothetical protein
MEDATVQKAARIGIANIRAKKSQVLNPPPSFLEKYNGTRTKREPRRMLEKCSLLAPSAGKGAFLIAGNYIGAERI